MEFLAEALARQLSRTLGLPGEKGEVLAYSLKLVFSTLLGYLAIVLGGWIFGVLPQALAVAITIALWRVNSGGAHCQSPQNCALLGALVTTFVGLTAQKLANYLVGLLTPGGRFLGLPVSITAIQGVVIFLTLPVLAMAALAAWYYAPADTPAKPITNPVKRARLRRKSFGFLALWGITSIISSFWPGELSLSLWLAGTLGLLWQAFSLTPGGYKVTEAFERVLGSVNRKGG